ncbi:type IV toxin-antitoxin system AbiEi family antitoxin domain-containing protein [Lachnospira multipara]|uniref:Transcriptional regulator, AbiEi antitoxin, Type IV TA system n=1 Tax=Lachnospira multipara TaxID=28051 RepID=A0A1H5X166_9FIRM|nr:type IV toxin-antitoxin system AbiEi family antitoxin domain-containing protein [Lachnospira multipara]SEG05273.1 Transcriptional regulator, AbiEi antitoxin, Type IV TA system [Lachnospira multipara]
MNNVIEKLIAESTDGLVKVTDVEAYGGDRRALKSYVNNNKLMRVGRGLYQITDEWEDDLYILSVKYENRNINLLMDYAEQLHVKKKILRYMEVLL